MLLRSTSIVFTLLFLATGCEGGIDDSSDFRSHSSQGKAKGKDKKGHIYPGAEWKVEAPEKHGLFRAGLEQMAQLAEDLDSSCMMVIHNGVLVGEWYWNGFERDTQVVNAYSTTKSVTSMLVGIAQGQGHLDINDSAAVHIPEWVGTASEDVTIRNLISNDSGRFWSFASDYLTGLFPADDQTAYAIGLDQEFEPGTVWEYNNSAIQALEAVLSDATGQNVADYAREQLFEPIGASANMASDVSGNPLTYQGVTASCDDMARLGYLALRGGQWKGQQILPQGWVQESTQPTTDLNAAYGYMWWLNREGTVVEPSFPGRVEYDGQLLPGVSDDYFIALGAFGQLIAVDPTEGYVVIRLQNIADPIAEMATHPDPVGLNYTRALLAALDEAKI